MANTWSDVIEEAIIECGYVATLKDIYRIAISKKDFSGLTPQKTINERVQRDSRFVKLMPGLYGLKNHLDKVPDEVNPNVSKTEAQKDEITHSYIQGLLLEIGNINGFKTYSPDKGGNFLGNKLSGVMSCEEVPCFTFEKIVKSTRFIDVIWFNERNFPNSVFEVENTTNFRNSLVKFVELQDFRTSMYLIAPNEQSKKSKYEQEIERSAFVSIKDRVKFFDYEKVVGLHSAQVAVNQYKDFFKY